MPYDFELAAEDVILSTWEERDRMHVALHLKEGEDGQGETLVEWWDEDCVQAFEDGFLKRDRIGRLRDGDRTLLESALSYAKQAELATVADLTSRVNEAVRAAEAGIAAAYASVERRLPHEEGEDDEVRRDLAVGKTVAETMRAQVFGRVSESRFEEIAEYLTSALQAELEAPVPGGP